LLGSPIWRNCFGMWPMRSEIPEFVQRFNQVIEDCEHLCSIARDSDLQRDASGKLEREIAEVIEEKNHAIKDGNENYANCLLGCEYAARAILAELRMWLLLKREEPEAAWDQLINAQHALCAAMRAHVGFSHLVEPLKRLSIIEDVVFPPQIFSSAGLIAGALRCSVCGEDYEECPHLAGKPYMGRFCAMIAENIELDHVAIVDRPADKRCRTVSFETNGGVRNRMTWRLEPKVLPQSAETEAETRVVEGGLRATSIIMRAD